MTNTQDAMRMALDLLNEIYPKAVCSVEFNKQIADKIALLTAALSSQSAGEQALAQQAVRQEPVYFVRAIDDRKGRWHETPKETAERMAGYGLYDMRVLYTAPIAQPATSQDETEFWKKKALHLAQELGKNLFESLTEDSPTDVNHIAQPAIPEGWRQELLDLVSACQSAYCIENTPGHEFKGVISDLTKKRHAIVCYVDELLSAAPSHPLQDK